MQSAEEFAEWLKGGGFGDRYGNPCRAQDELLALIRARDKDCVEACKKGIRGYISEVSESLELDGWTIEDIDDALDSVMPALDQSGKLE